MKKTKNIENYTAEELRAISECAPCFGADYNFRCNKCGNIVDSETDMCDRCGSYDIIPMNHEPEKRNKKWFEDNFEPIKPNKIK